MRFGGVKIGGLKRGKKPAEVLNRDNMVKSAPGLAGRHPQKVFRRLVQGQQQLPHAIIKRRGLVAGIAHVDIGLAIAFDHRRLIRCAKFRRQSGHSLVQ